ncbi:MAG: type III secretion system export apparatus subunit SctU [Burkholderiaceae bacterium]|jgi:type III secretion YscU/HrpY family protein|nr:type III secretion system export apparatus subunit SctU [Burkholderiaceae bacterium]
MSSNDDSGSKTEKPTPKKLQDARKKGDISKSRDLTSTAGLLVILSLTMMALPWLGEQIVALVEASFDVMQEPFANAAPRLGRQAVFTLLTVVGTVAAPIALIGVLVEFVQAGPVMTIEKLKPKVENLNPVNGLKRMFSMNNLVELIKSICKTVIVGVIAWLALKSALPSLPFLVGDRPLAVGSAFWDASWTLLAWAGGAFVLVAAADLAWQRYSFMKKMRMSMRDIRQEMKDMEGDPHVKGARKQLQQEWAQQGANQAASSAYVVVVNPTHVAIAIDYDRERCPVPTVTAKGENDDALAMRQAAQDAGVPVLRNVELARQLLRDAETGELVPAELFDLIATVVLWAQDVRHELACIRGEYDDTGAPKKPRRRRPPPGEDLTFYGMAHAQPAGSETTATRPSFMRYVPRRWRNRSRHGADKPGARQ